MDEKLRTDEKSQNELIEELRTKIHGVTRNPMTPTALTEKNWWDNRTWREKIRIYLFFALFINMHHSSYYNSSFSRYHYVSKVMEAIKKSHLSLEYGRLMPWNSTAPCTIQDAIEISLLRTLLRWIYEQHRILLATPRLSQKSSSAYRFNAWFSIVGGQISRSQAELQLQFEMNIIDWFLKDWRTILLRSWDEYKDYRY